MKERIIVFAGIVLVVAGAAEVSGIWHIAPDAMTSLKFGGSSIFLGLGIGSRSIL